MVVFRRIILSSATLCCLSATVIAGCSHHDMRPQERSSTRSQAVEAPFSIQVETQLKLQHYRDVAQVRMLRALTPEHRDLLAHLVGRLATSERPNVIAAAEQLDASLTPAEKKAILDTSTTLSRQEDHIIIARDRALSGISPRPIIIGRQTFFPVSGVDPGAALLGLAMQVASWRTVIGSRS